MHWKMKLAETHADMSQFTQLLNKSPTEYVEAFWIKALKYDIVYDEYVLNDIFWSFVVIDFQKSALILRL